MRAQNLLTNGGFEAGATGWTPIANGVGAVTAIDVGLAHTGSNSARLALNQATIGSVGWVQSSGLLPGHSYEFSFAVRTSNADLMAFPLMAFTNNGADQVFDSGFFSGGTADWQVHGFRFTVPAQVNGMTIMLLLYGRTGTAWFDDISLAEITDRQLVALTVDLSTNGGAVRRFAAVNGGPVWPGNPRDMTPQIAAMGLDRIRLHDLHGPADMDVIFPDQTADPQLPSSYDFASTDSVVAAIVNTGAEILFRLGASFGARGAPPANATTYAQACLHVAQHYNEGWAGGFFYNIRDWEVWNEPDLAEFWTGTVAEYAHLYVEIARAFKAHNPSWQVGGPAVANIWDRAMMTTFLDTVIASGAPLDFFSYHMYSSSNPMDFATTDSVVAAMLTGYGLGAIPRYLTEWNTYSYNVSNVIEWGRDDPLNAARTVAAIAGLQGTGLSRAYRYRLDEYYFPLVRDDGTLSYGGQAFQAIKGFTATPLALAASGSDQAGLSILAGKSMTGAEANVLIANSSTAAGGYTLAVQGLPVGTSWQYTVTRIDTLHVGVVVDSGVVTAANPMVVQTVKAPFVDRVYLVQTGGSGVVPGRLSLDLHQYPNPFNPGTDIFYTLPGAGSMSLGVYDAAGRRVRLLLVGRFPAGLGQQAWDGRDDQGRPVPSGVYFARLVASRAQETIKMSLVR